MSLFSESKERKMLRWETEKGETHALLERLAHELVDDVRAEQPEWLKKYIEEYERDVANYSFKCKRHGGFLTLFVTRSANPQTLRFGKPHEQILATTINLGGCREIRLTTGHPPDLLGQVGFYYTLQHKNGGGETIGGTQFGNYAAHDGARWEVRRPTCWVSHYGRPLVAFDPPAENERHSGMVVNVSDDNYKIQTIVDKSARAAQDDTIRFEGVGATLHAPASLGDGVHTKIMKALE